MHCPIHDTTLRTTDHDDFDVACPECRQDWSSRGELYELPPRPPDERLHTSAPD